MGSSEGTNELLLPRSLQHRPEVGSEVDTDPANSKSRHEGSGAVPGVRFVGEMQRRGKCFPGMVGEWLASPSCGGRAAKGGGVECGQLKMREKRK